MVTLTSKQVEYVHVCNFEIDLFKLVLILKKTVALLRKRDLPSRLYLNSPGL